MAHINRNFVIAYTLLVALPLVGLVGVLRSGRKLTAPISVDGLWQLHVDPERMGALPCGKMLADPETALLISQSGRNFALNLSPGPKSNASGVIDGNTLKASIVPSAEWSAQAGCGNNHELLLMATVDPRVEPRSLTGVLWVNGCPACGSVEFRAARQAPPVRKGTR
jgi:hypothetical protein